MGFNSENQVKLMEGTNHHTSMTTLFMAGESEISNCLLYSRRIEHLRILNLATNKDNYILT